MNEEIVKVISSLGEDGLSAFYVYLAIDTAQLLLFLGLVVWGCRAAWKVIKKDLES